jgi:hypothetical protein
MRVAQYKRNSKYDRWSAGGGTPIKHRCNKTAMRKVVAEITDEAEMPRMKKRKKTPKPEIPTEKHVIESELRYATWMVKWLEERSRSLSRGTTQPLGKKKRRRLANAQAKVTKMEEALKKLE